MTSYADVVQSRKESLTRKTERFSTFSENASKRSNEHWEKSDLSFIPLGQPILMGHHSQRAHENAIARSNAHSYKSIEEQDKSKKWARRAESAESLLVKMEESKPYMASKISDAKKDIRFWSRRLEKSDIFIKAHTEGKLTDLLASLCGFQQAQIESARSDNERSKIEIAQATEKKEFWEKKLASIGGVFDVSTLKKGDMIKCTCGIFPVKSVNAKSVTVLNWLPGIPESRKNLPFALIEGAI
jgi:hypothetical protein